MQILIVKGWLLRELEARVRLGEPYHFEILQSKFVPDVRNSKNIWSLNMSDEPVLKVHVNIGVSEVSFSRLVFDVVCTEPLCENTDLEGEQ